MLKDNKIRKPETVKAIGELAAKRISETMSGSIYKSLALRDRRTNKMMKMQSDSEYGEYEGRYKVYLPIFKSSVNMWDAGINGAFNTDPFVSIVPEQGTPPEVANNVQTVTNWNVRETEHRDYFADIGSDIARIGMGIGKHSYKVYPKIVPSFEPSALEQAEIQFIEQSFGNDYSERVHPCNFIQDDSVTDSDIVRGKCQWVGELLKMDLSNISAIAKSEFAIKENVDKVRKAMMDTDADGKQSDWTKPETSTDKSVNFKGKANFCEMYGKFRIKGNEDDYRNWKVIVEEKTKLVIFIKQVFDHPYTKYIGRKLGETYLGVGPAEGAAGFNLISNLITNKGIENLVNNLQRYIFYMADSGLSARDLQNVPQNGFVPFDFRAAGVQQMSQAIQEFQGRDVSVDSMQTYMALLNDWTQRETHQSDLLDYGMRPSLGKSLSHTGSSATAANLMDQRTQIPTAHFMNRIAEGQEAHWEKKIRSLQINLPDYLGEIVLGSSPETFRKEMILGKVKISILSGLKTNKMTQLNRLQELYMMIQGVVQFADQRAAAGMGNPININLDKLVESAAKLGDMPDRETIFPKIVIDQAGPVTDQNMAAPAAPVPQGQPQEGVLANA
jgi:hypothetical protein